MVREPTWGSARHFRNGLNSRGRSARGFTLIELMVVVVIIGVLAAIALPAISQRMRDRRTQSVAQEISTIYRNARLRALGRGAAVMVRYTNANNGTFEVLEAVLNTTASGGNCVNLPTSSCTTAVWTTDGSRTIATYAVSQASDFLPVHAEMVDPAPSSTVVPAMDVCFTPLGRTYARTNAAALTSTYGVPLVRVWRNDGAGSPVGLTRIVLIPPNGAARLGTAEAKSLP